MLYSERSEPRGGRPQARPDRAPEGPDGGNSVDKIIEVKGLQKAYGAVKAVKGLDFYVERGKLFTPVAQSSEP